PGLRHRAWLRHSDGEYLGPDCRHLQRHNHRHGNRGDQYPADRAGHADRDRRTGAPNDWSKPIEPQRYRRPKWSEPGESDAKHREHGWRLSELVGEWQCRVADREPDVRIDR